MYACTRRKLAKLYGISTIIDYLGGKSNKGKTKKKQKHKPIHRHKCPTQTHIINACKKKKKKKKKERNNICRGKNLSLTVSLN